MTEYPIIPLVLLSYSLCTVYSRVIHLQNSKNQFKINVNGNDESATVAAYEYYRGNSSIKHHEVKRNENPVRKTEHTINITLASSFEKQKKYEDKKLSNCLKVTCERNTSYEICFSRGNLRRRQVKKRMKNKLCENSMVQDGSKTEIHSPNVKPFTSYGTSNNTELKKRCCRHHLKFYFKYFPVLQTYQVELLESIEKNIILSTILDVSFTMSIFSLIFLTMTISRKLREERGNIILIHFCISIIVQIILSIIICRFEMDVTASKIMSFTFQYFTLVEFAWTSVIAFTQYRRYVTIIYCDQSYSIAKISTVVYISSAIPIAVRAIWDPDHSKFMTYLTFSLPQFITLIINFVILFLITRNIMCVRAWYPHQKRGVSREAKLVFTLFLILDLGWIIALLAILTSNILFAYIFIYTQSLQGFVLFFAFIVMNRCNREILKKKLTNCGKEKSEISSRRETPAVIHQLSPSGLYEFI
ncbi:adhesion G-protein coupled receptor D1-like [Coccinella septempunctata]|uniref:adhesion G-protein coupled receptor D1-like n=1 Tax=Coccinella septempunctata TaxID=41139 RepID=UPI001D07BDF2|nr:adhesion G-protein coupled receptor D1-like [Coccinella septempunctata]